MLRSLLSLAVAALASTFTWNSPCALLLTDSFNSTNGPLITVSGGSWVHHSPASSGTGEVQVVSSKVVLTQNNAEDVGALLASQPYPISTGTVLYASFRLNCHRLPSGAGDYFAHFKGSGTSGYRGRIYATTNNSAPGTFRLGVANGSATWNVLCSSNLVLNTEYLIVFRHGVSNGVTTLWVNPTSEADFSVTAADTPSLSTIVGFALRQTGSTGAGFGDLSLDDLQVGTSFSEVAGGPVPSPPYITSQPSDLIVNDGAPASFTVAAEGDAPLNYRWFFRGAQVDGGTGATLSFAAGTNQAGPYFAVVSNYAGFVTSSIAQLTVNPLPTTVPGGFSVLTYNVKGNNATNWSTNSTQVRAIGRVLQYLNPDIITFNEIPRDYTWEMTNFVAAFLPGYHLATNSGTDGFIRSVIASRFPIAWSSEWLDGASLADFGFSGNFTRDLFQAQIQVPGFPVPVNIFTTHLKATTSSPQLDTNKRGAEASAISNFFVNVYLAGTNALQPYVLTGDLNEDIYRPDTNRYTSSLPIQRLISPPVGLDLTTPANPFSGKDFTLSIQSSLNVRFDYILPCSLLSSNVVSSQVFRSGLLPSPPPPLLTNDDRTASDHLPVLMVFRNPFDKPFRLLSLSYSNQLVRLNWESVRGQPYRIEQSDNSLSWSPLASGISATGSLTWFSTNISATAKFLRVRAVPAQ